MIRANGMIDALTEVDHVRHAAYEPGAFPEHWLDAAYELHCRAWPNAWEGQLSRERFVAQLNSDQVNTLHAPNGSEGQGSLLAYVKWKATEQFQVSRDRLSDPSLRSLSSGAPAGFVCAYEITATADSAWRGLGRRLLTETLVHWQRDYADSVFCTYSPKRGLTETLRQLAAAEQFGRPALEAFAHRTGAAASRHIEEWVDHLAERFGRDVIEGVVAAIGIAYNFVFRARTGQPACGPAAFHRALGAEHWRQYPGSATGCADALGLVDHWRYSHDPDRREKCAGLFREQRKQRARSAANPQRLVVLA